MTTTQASSRPATVPDGDARRPGARRRDAEHGSMVSEYGLVAVLGATIAGVAIAWAKGGAIAALLASVLRQLQTVVAA